MRFLTEIGQSSDPLPPAKQQNPLPFDSDVVVILAVLLCAIICLVCLALAARCAWRRRSALSPSPAPPTKGLKKEAVRALPTLAFASSSTTATDPDPESAGAVGLIDCAICLTEFTDGDVVRVLPPCGHGFHAECVDKWLRSHSSCPSCRQNLAPPLQPGCQKAYASSGAAAKAKAPSATFLP